MNSFGELVILAYLRSTSVNVSAWLPIQNANLGVQATTGVGPCPSQIKPKIRGVFRMCEKEMAKPNDSF